MNSPRRDLLLRLNEAVQRQGNQTVLFTNAISARVGLSATEFECLSLLWEHGPLTAGQLAQRCGLSTGGITGLVDRLEKGGFVHRLPDPKDRRRVIIEPIFQNEVAQKIRALYRPVSREFDKLTTQYTDEQLAIILSFMQCSNDMIEHLVQDMKESPAP